MKRLVTGLFAGLFAAIGVGSMPVAASTGAPTIVGIASSTPAFSTLTAALDCSGLAAPLNGHRHYTVLAPTNDAFAKLGLNAGNVCSVLPQATLKNILLYHVIPGNRFAKSVLSRHPGHWRTIETLLDDQSFQVNSQGTIRTPSGGTSQIVQANIQASNGVIHVIDSVLIPGAQAQNDGD